MNRFIRFSFLQCIIAMTCILDYINLNAQARIFGQTAESKLVIQPLVNNVFRYTTYNTFGNSLFPSNSLYLVSEAGVILIDTPWDSTQFQPLLDSIYARHQQEVKLCISTHFHADRTAGLEFFASKGIRTYSSESTLDLCIARDEKRAEFSFSKDTVFKLGSYEVHTYYPGPGHTEDNVVIWIPHAKVLFGGCFVKSADSKDLGNVADANIQKWERSIQNVELKFPDVDWVIPGHFDSISKNALKRTKKLVRKYFRNTQTNPKIKGRS